MASLRPFVERRNRARLQAFALRRRNQFRSGTLLQDRRTHADRFDTAAMLELHLDRFPAAAAMLAYVQTLLHGAEGDSLTGRQATYVRALEQAAGVLRTAATSTEALATLHGYQHFMALHDKNREMTHAQLAVMRLGTETVQQ